MRLLPLLAAGAALQPCAALPRRPSSPKLAPRAFDPLPVGSITPKGWLLKQLRIQAEGLSGHLSMFWNDVMDSVWIGGSGDGGLHERTPYWLNGVVPLAFLLENAGERYLPAARGIWKAPWGPNTTVCSTGVDMRDHDITNFGVSSAAECYERCMQDTECVAFVVDTCPRDPSRITCWLKDTEGAESNASCRCYGKIGAHPAPPIDIMGQVEKYVGYILAHQDPATGWLGPPSSGGGQYWGPSNTLQALYQYAEGKKDPAVFRNCTDAVLRHLLEAQRRMRAAPLTSWAAARWMDLALTAEWLLDNADVGAHEADLLALIDTLRSQGSDWEQWFETFTGNAGGHNVNNAQALKSAAVYYRKNSTAAYEGYSMPELSRRRMAHMDARYGLPHGGFNGDEILPDPPTRHPSRGFETCGVVEAMFSYNTMFGVHGDVRFADRAERLAYNALPATWASPKGGDMWAHQYLQAVNEINAIDAHDHIWTHDGPLSETYGLEPNYGCCTANFNQGWPKFASSLVYTTGDGGIAVGTYAPATAALPGGASVDIDTEYPFGDSVTVTVTVAADTPVYLRIPAWATRATVNGAGAANGTMHKAVAAKGKSVFTLEFNPEVFLEEWDNGAVSVHRGALLYSLPIDANYTVYAHHFGSDDMSNDYYLNPTSMWQYALDVNRSNPSASFAFQCRGYQPGAAPFNHTAWPTMLQATVRKLPSWGTQVGSAAEPPASPACAPGAAAACGPPVRVTLVPHGGTELRIGEWPTSGL
eukprot:TRINITY_DN23219_c0_g1_i1.p1 TRINITY_DN23219_c0_g1~~TRINITY_DN23219_c0_g1_i1.p1  ORF type:complete len:759 (+),score=211.75 TRINITY_DN23219_c0_g1_i1:84-2360(+)